MLDLLKQTDSIIHLDLQEGLGVSHKTTEPQQPSSSQSPSP